MCIAVYKPSGTILTEETLRNCFTSNRDGAGFAYIEPANGEDPAEICIQKGFFTFEKFMTAFKPFEDRQCLIHFRIATHRLVNGRNCHPWRVNDDLVFIHNGMISGMYKDGSLSDTGNFNETILKPLVDKCSDFYLTPEFKWLVENSISSGNKLAFLDTQGNYVIIHEDQGYWDQGCWFSNGCYRSHKQNYKAVTVDQVAAEEKAIKDKPVTTPVVNATVEPTDLPEVNDEENAITLEEQLKGKSDVVFVETLEELDEMLAKMNAPKSSEVVTAV